MNWRCLSSIAAMGILFSRDNSLRAKNQLIPAMILDGIPGTFNGACALHAAAGYQAFYSQLMISSPDVFQVFRAPTKTCF